MKNVPENMLVIPRKTGMNVDVHAFFTPSEKPDDALIEHLRNISRISGILRVIALPNFSPENNFVSGIAIGAEKVIIPGIIGGGINAGIRLLSVPVKTNEIRIQQLESAIGKVVHAGEHGEGIRFHEGDIRLILELGISALSDVAARSPAIGAVRIANDEEADMKKTQDSGSLVASSASISHRAIEPVLNKIGVLESGEHSVDFLSVEGVFNNKIAAELGISKNQLLVSFSSGSQAIGHQVAEEYMRIAREMGGENAPERILCHLNAYLPEGEAYLDAYSCVSNFAYVNRQIITAIIRHELRKILGNIAMPLLLDIPYNILGNEKHGQKQLWVHRRGVAKTLPPDDKGRHGSIILISGHRGGASYILTAGNKSNIALNSININVGYSQAAGKHVAQSQKALPHRNIDDVVRMLVDSGLADIVARLKSIASSI